MEKLSKYQIVCLGSPNIYKAEILETLLQRIKDLGLKNDSIVVIDENNFDREYKLNAPAFGLYFGDENSDFRDLDKLQVLISKAILILPIVSDLTHFTVQMPGELKNVNGTCLNGTEGVEGIVSCILEGFGLLRASRKLFISYKRDESSSVAIQLFEQLEKNGFDVFLDTHSIRPGEQFQDELWHRMTDSDVIVVLNTPNFLKSNWCEQELAEANSKSIGILQLIWPGHVLEDMAKLSIPIQLSDTDFVKSVVGDPIESRLTEETMSKIVQTVESLRARSLASRQNNLISEFVSASNKLKLDITLHPEQIITQRMANGKDRVFIPTVGIPQSFTYHHSEDLSMRVKKNEIDSVFLLYDHRSIRDKWLNHMKWLDGQLKVKSTKIVGIEEWLLKN